MSQTESTPGQQSSETQSPVQPRGVMQADDHVAGSTTPASPAQSPKPQTEIKVTQNVDKLKGGKAVGVEVAHADQMNQSETNVQASTSGVGIGRDNTGVVITGSMGDVIINYPSATSTPTPTDDAPAPGDAPYKGLLHFDVGDAAQFFGREAVTAQLVGCLRTQNFLAIVGASGSGKSSVVRAGVVAALQRGEPLEDGTLPPHGSHQWAVHIITPTATPLETLALSLTRDVESVKAARTLQRDMQSDESSLHLAVRRRLERTGQPGFLLVVDQFEELFTACKDETEQKQFVDNLLHAVAPETAGPTRLILTLRADFYDHCAQFPSLFERLPARQQNLNAMRETELRRAIEQPAQNGQWEFAPGLVDLLLQEVGGEPGALPLLSHALLETWRRRRGRRMTLQGYHEAGGVRGAIAQTADRLWGELDEAQRRIARNLFVRLTELGEGTQDTRRRASLRELGHDAPEVAAVLKKLADARLVTTGEASAEVAHEALIREWQTLRGWLDEDRDGLRVQRRLGEAAREWLARERHIDLLYTGLHLDEALAWRATHADADLSEPEREFLSASEQAQAQQRTQEAERQARELAQERKLREAEQKRAESERQRAEEARRLSRRSRTWALGATGFGLAALIVSLVAVVLFVRASNAEQEASNKAQEAINQANARATAQAQAQAQQRESFARELAVNALTQLDRDPELSILLAMRSVGETQTSAGVNALRQALEASRGRELAVLRGHMGAVFSAVYSANGKQIVTASADGTARVWDVASGRELAVLRGHMGAVFSAVYSADSKQIVTASADGTARVWDVSLTLNTGALSGRELAVLRGHMGAVRSALYSADGKQIVTASWDYTARVWDVASGRELAVLRGHGSYVNSAVYSTDGKQIVTASDDKTARVWDISPTLDTGALSGRELAVLRGHTGSVNSAMYSADGKQIVTASDDKTARAWDVSTTLNTGALSGRELAVLRGHESYVNSAVYSAEGKQIVTASADGTARVWDALSGRELAVLRGHESDVTSALFSADGKQIVTASADDTARVWDVSTPLNGGRELAVLRGHTGSVNSAAFSADGKQIVTAGADGTALLYFARTEDLLVIARTRVFRDFTCEERYSFLREPWCGRPPIPRQPRPPPLIISPLPPIPIPTPPPIPVILPAPTSRP